MKNQQLNMLSLLFGKITKYALIVKMTIKKDIENWRNDGYKAEFNEIKEILNFQKTEIENQYKYLRKAQFEAIEAYLF